jgi:OOP family OmpA-OmpF porin
MSTRPWRKFWLLLLAAATMTGCATMQPVQPLPVNPVTRDRGEPILVEQIVLVADVSASMRSADRFPVEKSLVRSFAASMPDGNYNSAIIDFGGRIDEKWYHQGYPRPHGTGKCACSRLPREATAGLSTDLVPLRRFSRNAMSQGAAALDYRGGKTPLRRALLQIGQNLRTASGRTAIVLFSDGCPTNEKGAAAECKKLVDSYKDEVCIHAVQLGSKPAGTEFMRKLVAMSNCESGGSFRTSGDLSTASQMEGFVRKVMLGPPPPPKPAPPPPPPPPPKPAPPRVIDTDGDGVPDNKDHCPNSPKGVAVNERGCWIIPGLNFDTNKYDIKPDYNRQLDDVADVLKKNPHVKIRVDGHTDSAGADDYNKKLSENRAGAVMDYLVEKGVAQIRLRAKGWGETQPIRANDTPENMLLNRRVELTTHFDQ